MTEKQEGDGSLSPFLQPPTLAGFRTVRPVTEKEKNLINAVPLSRFMRLRHLLHVHHLQITSLTDYIAYKLHHLQIVSLTDYITYKLHHLQIASLTNYITYK